MTVIEHDRGRVTVSELPDGRRRVDVELANPTAYMPHASCETAYPIPLIERVLSVRGPAMLCYSLRREEHPHDVTAKLRYAILSFVSPEEIAGTRLLDFGCGSGASTMILARILPDTTIVATDINAEEIHTARMRQEHYGFENMSFVLSERGDNVPRDLGQFGTCQAL